MLAVLGVFAAQAMVDAPSASADSGVYVVKRGDTLYRLSIEYGVEVSDFVRVNGLTNPHLLSVGQELVLPPGASSRYGGGAPAAQLAAVESVAPLSSPEPAFSSALTAGPSHTVARGDTLSRLAAQYGVSVYDIQTANGLANPNYIVTGQVLVIPSASSVVPASFRTVAPAPAPALPEAVAEAPVAEAAAESDFSRSATFKLTHYCLRGTMASGRQVYAGAVAADRSIFAIGTRLLIEGLPGVFIVEDRFGWDAGQNRLDIWVASCDEAIQRGVQYRKVQLAH